MTHLNRRDVIMVGSTAVGAAAATALLPGQRAMAAQDEQQMGDPISLLQSSPYQSKVFEAGSRGLGYWKPIPCGKVIAEVHFHVLVRQPSGGPWEYIDDMQLPECADWMQIWPHGWDLRFWDKDTLQSHPIAAIGISAVTWEDSPGNWKAQFRANFSNKSMDAPYYGQIGITGIATSSCV